MAIPETLKSWPQAIKQWPIRTRQYFAEVWSELKKVSWPARKEVYGTTVVVIVTMFVFGFYLWLVDLVLAYGVDRLFKFFRTTS